MTVRESVRARRRQRRRRKVIALGVAGVVVAGGAGTAWAMNRSTAPHYRLVTVTNGAVSQVVAADGTLAASRVADASFAVSGTVASVSVAVGDRITAGRTLATMDKSSLNSAVTDAKTSLASANETLTDDEDGTSTTSTSTAPAGSTGTVTGTATTKSAVTQTGATTTAVFTAARSAAPPPASGSSTLSAAQAKVSAAAKALAKALNGELDTVATQCSAVPTTVTSTVVAAADTSGTISGSTGADTTSVSTNGHSVTPASDGSWSLTGLVPATGYTVTITRQDDVVNGANCSDAVADAGNASSDVATALTAFNTAVTALQRAASATSTAGSGSGSTGSTGGSGGSGGTGSTGSGTTGSGPTGTSGAGSTGTGSTGTGSTGTGSTGTGSTGTGSTAGSTSASSGSTTVTVTSEKLAADVAAVAAAKAALAVAKNQLANAALTSPVSGTVASVGLTKGASVTAGSTSSAIEVVADGPLSVQLSIPLSKISLVKVGQVAHVTVDGKSASLPAKVTYVGLLNSSSSTGSSSTYTVTVQLNKSVAGLYDGMGAQVSIDVGTADNALVVPLSALHTTGTRQTVDVYSGATSTPTSVTVGVVGANTVQIKSGLKANQQVVLADTTQAIPSSTTTAGTGTRPNFTGFGGTGGFTGSR